MGLCVVWGGSVSKPPTAVSRCPYLVQLVDQELRLQELRLQLDRCGSSLSVPVCAHAQLQLERLQEDRLQDERLQDDRLQLDRVKSMLPVFGSISVFGVRPWFDVAPLPFRETAALSASSWSSPLIARSVASITPLTWFGVKSGCASSMSATAPATIGAAIEVPPARM